VIEHALAGTRLHLLPERAAYWPEGQCLLVADAHLGKAQSFRKLGVPVPGGTTEVNLQRLSGLIQRCGAKRLVFLGDLLHSVRSRSAALLHSVQRWREGHADVDMLLVRGNHDAHAGDPPPQWGLRCVDEPHALGPFALQHHPAAVPGAYALAGHVHPAVRLGSGIDQLRLPCFAFSARQGLLPAFGEFTGSHVLRPAPGDALYVVAGDEVRRLPTLPAP
jgi:uncharacterized protein